MIGTSYAYNDTTNPLILEKSRNKRVTFSVGHCAIYMCTCNLFIRLDDCWTIMTATSCSDVEGNWYTS